MLCSHLWSRVVTKLKLNHINGECKTNMKSLCLEHEKIDIFQHFQLFICHWVVWFIAKNAATIGTQCTVCTSVFSFVLWIVSFFFYFRAQRGYKRISAFCTQDGKIDTARSTNTPSNYREVRKHQRLVAFYSFQLRSQPQTPQSVYSKREVKENLRKW